MPSNQQRREAAKRKLQRQLARREQERTRRRRTTLIAGAVAVVIVAAGVVWLVTANKNSNNTAADANATASDASGTEDTASTAPATPCTYTSSGTAAKKVNPPANVSPAKTGTVDATIALNGETVAVTLDRSLAPCSVNSFLSLAGQGFYDNTSCHRLTKSAELNILQCGDPSGKGNGGPGYESSSQVAATAKYPVGTLAMANSSGQEGSQFFIVYGTTTIDPSYSIIGKVSDDGMKVVQSIAEKGVKDDRQDGAPNAEAKIESIKVPAEAVTASTSWASSSAGGDTGAIDTGAVPTEQPTDTGAADTGAADSGASESAPVSKTTTN